MEPEPKKATLGEWLAFFWALAVSFVQTTWAFWWWVALAAVIFWVRHDPMSVAVVVMGFWVVSVASFNVYKAFEDKTPIDDWMSRRWAGTREEA